MNINSFFAADDFTGEQCVLLSDHIASHAYDEAKERELFERTRNAHTIRRNAVGDYVLPSSQDAWSGWSECAKFRARSAE